MSRCLPRASLGARYSLRASRFLVISAACLFTSHAYAEFTETTSTSSAYSYIFLDDRTGASSGEDGVGNSASFALNGPFAGRPSHIEVDYSSVVGPAGQFDFLQNARCLGSCTVRIDTIVQSLITNSGPDPLSLRYDTQITPGHLGFQGSQQSTSAGFSIRIFEGDDPTVTALYDMAGVINGEGLGDISGSGPDFNGLTYFENEDQRAFDWGATNVSIILDPLAPGESRLINLLTSTFVDAAGGCDILIRCDAAQAAFGDPRNNGGVTSFAFTSYSSYARVVAIDAPLPPPPPPYEPPVYTPRVPVPEPASWATMIAGFATLGGSLRRRALRIA